MKRSLFFLLVSSAALWPFLALAQETTDVDDSGSAFDGLLNMSPIAAYMLICAIVGPFAIAAINRTKWSSTLKVVTTAAVCVVASFGWFLFKGEIVPVGKWLRLTVLIFVGATIMYHLFKPAVKEVEAKTG